jgi:hypothetical protein
VLLLNGSGLFPAAFYSRGSIMIWFVRIMVVCLFVFYGAALTSQQIQPSVPNFIKGFFTGLMMMIGLSLLVGSLCKKISAKAPNGAKRAGIVLYWLGNAIAISCIGLAVLVALQGMPARLAVIVASFAPFYWASGWGLRHSLSDTQS